MENNERGRRGEEVLWRSLWMNIKDTFAWDSISHAELGSTTNEVCNFYAIFEFHFLLILIAYSSNENLSWVYKIAFFTALKTLGEELEFQNLTNRVRFPTFNFETKINICLLSRRIQMRSISEHGKLLIAMEDQSFRDKHLLVSGR